MATCAWPRLAPSRKSRHARIHSPAKCVIESPWRLLSEGRIVVTSEDDGDLFGLPDPVDAASRVVATVSGRTLETAAIDSSSGDLTVDFGGSTRLQFLRMSCGYESWRLYAQGSETICMGGGKIAHFPKR